MPPHGYERPTQDGPPPRARSGMRQAAAPDSAFDPGDAEAGGWGPDGWVWDDMMPDGRGPDDRTQDSRGQDGAPASNGRRFGPPASRPAGPVPGPAGRTRPAPGATDRTRPIPAAPGQPGQGTQASAAPYGGPAPHADFDQRRGPGPRAERGPAAPGRPGFRQGADPA